MISSSYCGSFSKIAFKISMSLPPISLFSSTTMYGAGLPLVATVTLVTPAAESVLEEDAEPHPVKLPNNTAVTPIVAITLFKILFFILCSSAYIYFYKRSFKGLMDASTDNMPFFGFLSSQFGLFHIVVEISPAYSS